MTSNFDGFNNFENTFVEIPESFFSNYLPIASSIGEVKLCLYLFWYQAKSGNVFNGLTITDLLSDNILTDFFSSEENDLKNMMKNTLNKLHGNRALIKHSVKFDNQTAEYYFINNDKGKLSFNALLNGDWQPNNQTNFPIRLIMVRPNIYRLYEENIGPITPILSESLEEAEKEYSAEWIAEAFKIAIENNVRKWKYIEAVLKRWKEEGKHGRNNKRNAEEFKRKYSEGSDAEFFEN